MHAQAVNYLIGPAAALDAVQSRWPLFASDVEREVREKLIADYELLAGDPAPLATFRSHRDHTGSEGTFRSLVSGRRVLVLGPSPHNLPTADEVATADVIVTTRLPNREIAGGLPSIVYVADETFRANEGDYRAQLDARPDDLLVVRPSMLRQPRPRLSTHPRVRVMSFEDSTPFLGTHFAIQRLTYDLLASGPRSILLSGIDFFVGPSTYRPEYHQPLGSVTLDPPRLNFSHDYAYDFWYTKSLLRSGLVDVVPPVAQLLDESVADYLGRLENASIFTP